MELLTGQKRQSVHEPDFYQQHLKGEFGNLYGGQKNAYEQPRQSLIKLPDQTKAENNLIPKYRGSAMYSAFRSQKSQYEVPADLFHRPSVINVPGQSAIKINKNGNMSAIGFNNEVDIEPSYTPIITAQKGNWTQTTRLLPVKGEYGAPCSKTNPRRASQVVQLSSSRVAPGGLVVPTMNILNKSSLTAPALNTPSLTAPAGFGIVAPPASAASRMAARHSGVGLNVNAAVHASRNAKLNTPVKPGLLKNVELHHEGILGPHRQSAAFGTPGVSTPPPQFRIKEVGLTPPSQFSIPQIG